MTKYIHRHCVYTGLTITLLAIAVVKGVHASDFKPSQDRPKIGLALSGGGARGAAHVGVLKYLEEKRIPIDYIAGTSMGSIIGGLYASGMSPDEIEHVLAEMDWDGVFVDAPVRGERTYRRKTDDRLFLSKIKPGIKDGDVNLAPALVQGQKFALALKRLTLPVAEIRDFDKLRIPYRAVATDITTGKQVVLGTGELSRAMHASMAVPAAFSAIEIDGVLLVDGGIANNLPVSVVRDMGADIIIAVDISTPLQTRDKLDSGPAVVKQLTGILTRRNTELQIASLTDRDTLIVPELGKIGSADFERVLEAVPIGEKAARQHSTALARLSLTSAQYAQYRSNQYSVKQKPMKTIDFVRIENNSDVSNETIASHLDLQTGKVLNLDELEQAVGRVYGMDIFESVRYDIIDEDGKTGVIVSAREKSWGTSSLQAGLELSADLDGNSFFNIGVLVNKIPLNRLNGEWRTLVKLGEEPSLFTEIYQPLDPAEKWFVQAGIGYESNNITAFTAGQADTEFDLDSYVVKLGAGYNLERWGRVQLLWERATGDAAVTVGDPADGFDFEQGELQLTASIDTIDNVHFPGAGVFGSLGWTASRDNFGADVEFDQYHFSLGGARHWGKHTVIGTMRYNTTDDDNAPIQNLFRLGGFLRLSGLQQNELSGQHSGLLAGGYMYRLPAKIVPMYLGGSIEVGNVWQTTDQINLDNTRLAGSVFVGADTVLGPLYTAVGFSEGGEKSFYIFLGQPWF